MNPNDIWRETKAATGRIYYYKKSTRETTWTKPAIYIPVGGSGPVNGTTGEPVSLSMLAAPAATSPAATPETSNATPTAVASPATPEPSVQQQQPATVAAPAAVVSTPATTAAPYTAPSTQPNNSTFYPPLEAAKAYYCLPPFFLHFPFTRLHTFIPRLPWSSAIGMHLPRYPIRVLTFFSTAAALGASLGLCVCVCEVAHFRVPSALHASMLLPCAINTCTRIPTSLTMILLLITQLKFASERLYR